MQRGYPAMVMRYITADMPRLDSLGLPEIVTELTLQKRGLLLMVGATGSGKSTTLAAMINYRNENASDHIVTIEDPIEFLHTNKRSLVNQREVGLDTKSYMRALRGVVRAAPDVILIGEVRDHESMEAAINLSGTGHLVLATLHANNCAESLDRIINMFPREQHNQIFLDLSQYLRAIMAQRLVMGKDGRGSRRSRSCSTRRTSPSSSRRATWCRSRKPSPPAATSTSRASMPRCSASTSRGASRWKRRSPTPTRAPTSKPRSTSASTATGHVGARTTR